MTLKVAVAVLPAASRTVTVRTFKPGCRVILPADQVVVPEATPLPPRSFAQVTRVTPPLSEARPLNGTTNLELVVYVALEVGDVIVTVGRVVSVPVPAVRFTVRVVVAVLPEASRAVTVSTLEPVCRLMPLAVQLVVPEAVPLPPRPLTHVTWVTPTLSDARPANVTAEAPVV